MDLSFRFDRWWNRLPASPVGSGVVEGLVIRPAGAPPGTREQPAMLTLSPEEGVVGDRWPESPGSPRDAQVSLINAHALRALVAAAPGLAPGSGGEERALSAGAATGDNLQVDLALDEAALPAGSLLEVGSALLRVGSTPHRPCAGFAERMGPLAAKRVARALRKGLRGRGVLCEVLRAGEVRVGDRIQVVSRAPGGPLRSDT